jgi:sulfur-oxidizing protein SoxZ
VSAIRLAVPATASRGDVVEVKAMIRHEMESGHRRDEYGRQIPQFIIKYFECRYNGRQVFRAEFFPAIAANPLLSFFVRASESGVLEFRWIDQDGHVETETARIEVS